MSSGLPLGEGGVGGALRVQSWRINKNEFLTVCLVHRPEFTITGKIKQERKKRRVKKERMVLPFKEACPQLPAWASETLILCQREKQLGNGNLRFHFLSIRESSSLKAGVSCSSHDESTTPLMVLSMTRNMLLRKKKTKNSQTFMTLLCNMFNHNHVFRGES